ncbi:MAG: sulfur carrier protein [Solirubrobacteraceae bacterium]|nr:sulfur carrier protein [Solirubrobacteraceae bacterium]
MIVHVNGEPTELAEGATVADVLERLEVDRPRRGLAVAVDAEVVPRSEWDARPLGAGERVEVLNAIQGG